MRLHVAVVQDYLPEIPRFMAGHAISPRDLYDASAHFAQFTGVTP